MNKIFNWSLSVIIFFLWAYLAFLAMFNHHWMWIVYAIANWQVAGWIAKVIYKQETI